MTERGRGIVGCSGLFGGIFDCPGVMESYIKVLSLFGFYEFRLLFDQRLSSFLSERPFCPQHVSFWFSLPLLLLIVSSSF